MTQPLLSRDEVFKIVGKKLNSAVCSNFEYKVVPVSERNGYCGDHYILTVALHKDNGAKIFTFFVKMFPEVPISAEFAEQTGAFRKETFIYNLFEMMMDHEGVDLLQKCVPKCFFIDGKRVVVENLVEQGYRTLDKRKLLDYDTVVVVLEALAKLHASSLIYEERVSKRLGRNYRLGLEHAADLEESFFSNSEGFPDFHLKPAIVGIVKSAAILDFPQELRSGKNFQVLLQETCQKVFTLVKASKKGRNVICHGDLWATNFLVKYDEATSRPIAAKLVDFQCGRYAPPGQDVMSLLHLTTSRKFRRNNLYNLLGVYYSNLESNLLLAGFKVEEIVPFGEFLSNCEEQKIFGRIQAAIYFPIIMLENLQGYFESDNRAAIYEDRSLLVVDNADKDVFYRTRVEESLQDLQDYCEQL